MASVRRRPLRILIATGPTREPLDPVRFISNYSTGTMGQHLAETALRRGHRVRMVSGPTGLRPPRGAAVRWVERTDDMRRALARDLHWADALVMAAAVADFRPAAIRRSKLPRRSMTTMHLRPTTDVIGTLPRRRHQLRVGFALETERLLPRAAAKLKAKRLDLIVANQGSRRGKGPFGARPVRAAILDASGRTRRLGTVSKRRLAAAVLDSIERLWYGQPELTPATSAIIRSP